MVHIVSLVFNTGERMGRDGREEADGCNGFNPFTATLEELAARIAEDNRRIASGERKPYRVTRCAEGRELAARHYGLRGES